MLQTRYILLVFILALSGIAQAQLDINLLEPCQKVLISGDGQWPPYVIVAKNATDLTGNPWDLSGIGVDLTRKLFAELDLPVEEVAFENQINMVAALRNGQIDVLVSTYKYNELTAVADIFQPAYIDDPVTVAVRKETLPIIKDWADLVGLTGLMDQTFMVDDTTNAFFSEYLNFHSRGTIQEIMLELVDKKIGYVIGSRLQLTYLIQENNWGNDLVVVDQLSKGGGVYMAFSKSSPCRPYAVYASKRLQDYKNNGTVDEVIKKYIH